MMHLTTLYRHLSHTSKLNLLCR